MTRHTASRATAHAAQFDPAIEIERGVCRGTRSARALDVEVCWTSTTNPTATHLDERERHRKLAAAHRGASQALKDAEARACAGLSENDRDMSPFAHREDIAQVEVTAGGATILFKATPGLTAQSLQRVVDCHVARNAALGNDVPEMLYCPLVLKTVKVRAEQRDAGVAVEVTSNDVAVSKEIGRRVQGLTARRP